MFECDGRSLEDEGGASDNPFKGEPQVRQCSAPGGLECWQKGHMVQLPFHCAVVFAFREMLTPGRNDV